MTDETTPLGSDSARQAALNAALAGAFPPPATPPELTAGVLAAIAREPATDWQARRRALEQEHRAAISGLNRRYLRRCRDALLVAACLLVVLGYSIRPLSDWLTPFFVQAAPMIAGCMALAVGVLCGAAMLQDLFKDTAHMSTR
jgi:peptidoglycan/LPS O-acetylase OafA/YrhL